MNESPIAWKSSRQTVISLSTAESKLLEIIEGFTLGESTSVVFEEVMGDFSKVLWSDSQSALAVLSGEGGSLEDETFEDAGDVRSSAGVPRFLGSSSLSRRRDGSRCGNETISFSEARVLEEQSGHG